MLHAVVVAIGLELLVAEILHRFVVDQAVHRARSGNGIQFIHLSAVLGAPFGNRHGRDDVEHHHPHGNQRKYPVELHQQDSAHQEDFQKRGQNAKQQIIDDGRYAHTAAVYVTRNAAGLPLQMKTQRQVVQMPERFDADLADDALGDLGKDHVSQIGKQSRGQAQQAVSDYERSR